MSFNIVLSTNSVYATNTAGKDYVWAYDFSQAKEGDYLVTFDFQCGLNPVEVVNFNTNGPVQLSADFGSNGQNYLAGSTFNNVSTRSLGLLSMNFATTTNNTYFSGTDDNYPILFKNINRNANFINVKLIGANGSLINNPVTPWIVILVFTKV